MNMEEMDKVDKILEENKLLKQAQEELNFMLKMKDEQIKMLNSVAAWAKRLCEQLKGTPAYYDQMLALTTAIDAWEGWKVRHKPRVMIQVPENMTMEEFSKAVEEEKNRLIRGWKSERTTVS